MAVSSTPVDFARCAGAAGEAVRRRHLRRLWALPGTRLGVIGWPATAAERLFGPWDYWWQAHLLDCLVDEWRRAPSPDTGRLVRQQIRGHFARNALHWTNRYYDDMAWLALALLRAQASGLVSAPRAVSRIVGQILGAWSETDGGIPWRKRDDFRNVPANGPAAILLARTGHLERADDTASWIEDRLHDAETGLVLDGLHPGRPIDRAFYTYNQGAVLGAETELAVRIPRQARQRAARVADLVTAVDRELATDGVLRGHGGGDGGLFTGILARYLAVVAARLPGSSPVADHARSKATELVQASAAAAWHHKLEIDGLPLFGPDWATPASHPTRPGRSTDVNVEQDPAIQAHDLSVQLGAWMLLEAAARLQRLAG